MPKETVRAWTPTNDTDIAHIQGAIDSWDRTGQPSTRPPRDYAAIEAAVDRITKRVKTRKVTVTETVTEYVDAEDAPAGEAQATREAAPHHQVEDLAAVTEPVDKPKKLGFFARRKQAKAAKGKEPEFRTVTPVAPVAAAPPRTVTVADDDAWDPGTPAAATSAPKPLQSKAAKRTAAKKAGKKKR